MKRSLILVILVGCGAQGDPALLDHAQILAVRSEPAHARPGGRVRIDVLASDAAGNVFVAVPDSVTVGQLPVVWGSDGWYVTAPAPLAPMAEVALTVDDTALRAQKQLVFSDEAPNPAVDMMQVDGNASSAIAAAMGTKPTLGVTSDAVEPATYAWYTSIGKLEHYRRADATFDADELGGGTVLIVVRDAQGGVGWQQVPATVQ